MVALWSRHPCNLRCVYCNSPYLRTPELTAAQWLGIVDQLADLGCRRIAVLGGEPLLRDDLDEILARVRERGMHCALTSNGTLVPRRIALLGAGAVEQNSLLALEAAPLGRFARLHLGRFA